MKKNILRIKSKIKSKKNQFIGRMKIQSFWLDWLSSTFWRID